MVQSAHTQPAHEPAYPSLPPTTYINRRPNPNPVAPNLTGAATLSPSLSSPCSASHCRQPSPSCYPRGSSPPPPLTPHRIGEEGRWGEEWRRGPHGQWWPAALPPHGATTHSPRRRGALRGGGCERAGRGSAARVVRGRGGGGRVVVARRAVRRLRRAARRRPIGMSLPLSQSHLLSLFLQIRRGSSGGPWWWRAVAASDVRRRVWRLWLQT
jgi:hypothetical protein